MKRTAEAKAERRIAGERHGPAAEPVELFLFERPGGANQKGRVMPRFAQDPRECKNICGLDFHLLPISALVFGHIGPHPTGP